ncbi:MAG: 6-carboxytetrahydropterin synthase [candidate division Zixibacteria bacterium]|nr:6-carboxytetrahydropterin synthase [candidate division Zixibacteria bacterium]
MIAVTRRAYFCAGHRYWRNDWSAEKNREVFGACANEHGHGHNYMLDVTLEGEVDAKTGMLINLSELDQVVQERIITRLDHRNLNMDVPELGDEIPTTEVLARFIFEQLDGAFSAGRLTRVRVFESNDLWAECRRD